MATSDEESNATISIDKQQTKSNPHFAPLNICHNKLERMHAYNSLKTRAQHIRKIAEDEEKDRVHFETTRKTCFQLATLVICIIHPRSHPGVSLLLGLTLFRRIILYLIEEDCSLS